MNIQKMMQQAQQMQENLQKQLKQTKVEATAGGGMVTVVMNGVKEIQSLTIDPEVICDTDKETPEESVQKIVDHLRTKGFLPAQPETNGSGNEGEIKKSELEKTG